MDRVGADPEKALEQMRTRIAANPLVIQIPLGREEKFRGVIDIVEMKEIDWGDDLLGTKYEVKNISDEYKDEAQEKRNGMIEQLSDMDDLLMEKYLDGYEIPPEEIKQVIRKATNSLQLVPVIFGASFKNKGIQSLLNAVIDYLPSPLDIPPIQGHHPRTNNVETRKASDDESFSALVFKITNDPYIGSLSFIRVYSGKTKVGSSVYNATKGEEERIARILEMHSNKRKDIKEVYTGDIVALGAMKNFSTGDSLCLRNHPLILEQIKFPEPVISAYIEPKLKREHSKLAESLAKLKKEDPTFKIKQDPMTGQTLVYGMGELHLEVLMDRMEREFGVSANLGRPQVAYKETITALSEGEGKYVRQTGGRGQYGHCKIIVEPLRRGVGLEFVDDTRSGVIPREFIPSVIKGAKEAVETGIMAGFPVTDVKVTIIDGSYHEVDSSSIAFKIAGSLAFKDAMSKANPVLLEPIMSLEVVAPDEYLGDIVGGINARRGKIEEMEMRRGSRVLKALVPLEEMFGYATILRTLTQGRGVFSMEFFRYGTIPSPIMEEIIARIEGKIPAHR
jgi:elongation factor G